MVKRISWLIFFFLFRCVLGWSQTLGYLIDKPVKVKGNVVNIYYKDTDCIMVLSNILINSGKICAGFPGDEIQSLGTFERRVIDSFQGKIWLVSKQIETLDKTQKTENSKTQDRGWMNNFREYLVSVYKKYVPEPEAGLVAGIVLGYKKDIGQEFYNRMVKSGSIHIAVASGYNILLVGGVVLSLCFWFLKRNVAVVVALGAMIFYAVLAGGDPPVVRAVWMAGLMYLGQLIGRGSISWWILLFTAWVMLMIEPPLMASASFQLSVGASFGLMVIDPWLSKVLEKRIGSSLINFAGNLGVITTLSTMIATMPIIWWHFGRMTLIGILSNILILPFVPPLMILGVGLLLFPWVFSLPVFVLAHWIVMIIRFFGS